MTSPFNQRMKLSDYDGAIDFYVTLERQRSLTDEERDRLHQLVRRQAQCLAGARYRAKHADRVAASREAWRAKPKNKKKAAVRRSDYYQANRVKEQRSAKAWREANPDKVAAARVRSEAAKRARRSKAPSNAQN